jgi:hypothetical protein
MYFILDVYAQAEDLDRQHLVFYIVLSFCFTGNGYGVSLSPSHPLTEAGVSIHTCMSDIQVVGSPWLVVGRRMHDKHVISDRTYSARANAMGRNRAYRCSSDSAVHSWLVMST